MRTYEPPTSVKLNHLFVPPLLVLVPLSNSTEQDYRGLTATQTNNIIVRRHQRFDIL